MENCQHPGCQEKAILYCSSHQKSLCNNCAILVHSDCGYIEIKDFNRAKSSFKNVKKRLKIIQDYSTDYKLCDSYPTMEAHLDDYTNQVTEYAKRLKKAAKENKFSQVPNLELEIESINKSLRDSDLRKAYLNHKDDHEVASEHTHERPDVILLRQRLTEEANEYKEKLTEDSNEYKRKLTQQANQREQQLFDDANEYKRKLTQKANQREQQRAEEYQHKFEEAKCENRLQVTEEVTYEMEKKYRAKKTELKKNIKESDLKLQEEKGRNKKISDEIATKKSEIKSLSKFYIDKISELEAQMA